MKKHTFVKRKVYLRAWIIMCMILNIALPQGVEGQTPCEMEAIVRQLINPSQEYQLHAAALRNQLRYLLGSDQFRNLQALDSGSSEQISEADKRSLSSVMAGGRSWGRLPPVDVLKRSLATLAKNGQLPSQEPESDDSTQQWTGKRHLGSLARSGYFADKRNIGSLARDFQLPPAGKRNLAALARLGFIPSTTPKRNMASLARWNMLPTSSNYQKKREAKYWSDTPASGGSKTTTTAEKSGSSGHGSRKKRSLADENVEVPDYMLDNFPEDYEELSDTLDRMYNQYNPEGPQEEKRFLGSIARGGWYSYRPVEKRNIGSLARLGWLRSKYSDNGVAANTVDESQSVNELSGQQEQKRHIGALARSGWLPSSLRSIRSGRFSRSGRARSQIVEYYPQQERLRQPIAAVCRRCDDTQYQNLVSWGAPGLQSTWGTPPRLTALHWRSLRPTGLY